MPKVYKITHQTLTDVLGYDPATGVFTWKVARSNRVKVGSRAGVLHHASGGRYIAIDGEKFRAHRLAFFFVNERWPNTDVRPNDGNYDNCAISNLTEVSRVELQHARQGTVASNTSGYRGVSAASGGKWQAKITWNYKQFNLGANFESPESASEVYDEAERRMKLVSTPEEWERSLEELRVWRGQRTAWRFLQRSHSDHAWSSFDAFCADVNDVPVMRYAMVAVDVTKPIGPGNFRWAFPDGFKRSPGDSEARRFNRDHERNKELKKLFGIDFAEYQRMLVEQGGVCAICSKPEEQISHGTLRVLSVDHNHATGAVRGLLCSNCNLAIGYACDDVSILRRGIAYLEKHGATTSASMPTYLGVTRTRITDRLKLMEAAGHG